MRTDCDRRESTITRADMAPIPESLDRIGLVLVAALLVPGFLVQGITIVQAAGPTAHAVGEYLKLFVVPAVFVGLSLLRMKQLGFGLDSALRQPAVAWREVIRLGVLFGLIVFVSNAFFTSVSTHIVGWIIGPEAAAELARVEQDRSATLFSGEKSPLYTACLLFVLVVATPVAEELFFRGYVLHGLRQHWDTSRAIVISAVIFGAFHFYVIQLLPIFVAGLLFGWLHWRTQTLVAPMIAHAVVNGTVAGLLLMQAA